MTACCPHPVERHAYNGCANCGCGVQWTEHPDRDKDRSEAAFITFIGQRDMALDLVESTKAVADGWMKQCDIADAKLVAMTAERDTARALADIRGNEILRLTEERDGWQHEAGLSAARTAEAEQAREKSRELARDTLYYFDGNDNGPRAAVQSMKSVVNPVLVERWEELANELSPQRPERPSKADRVRVDRGDYVRASGMVTCDVCGCEYWQHATVQGFEWLHRACDGKLLKL